MGNVFYFEWEIRFIEWLQSNESLFVTSIAKFFTLLGEEYLLIFILGLFYWSIDKNLGKKISLSLLGATISGTLLKGLILRRRPYMDNKTIKCIRAAHPDMDIMSETSQGYSLPSLHATMSSSTYGTIAKNKKEKKYIVLAILLPLLIGLSRPYLGVHYPTDIIIGLILGTISIFLFDYIYNKYNYKVGFLIILIFGLIGFIYCHDDEFYSCYGIALGLFTGFIYEEKKVQFNNTKKIFNIILRPIIGVIIFIIVSTILKLPLRIINMGDTLLLIYRLIRYFISTFIIIGLYPNLFKKI